MVAVRERGDHRCPRPHDVARRHEVVRPPGVDEGLRLRRPGVTRDHHGASGGMGPQQRDLPRMRVRRPWLRQAAVAVVPHHDEADVRRRGEDRGAGPHDDPRSAPQGGEPAAVPRCRTEPGRESHDMICADHAFARREQSVEIALIGHHEDHAAARRGDDTGQLGQPRRPVLTGKGLPRGARPAPRLECLQEVDAVGVRRPRLPIRLRRLGDRAGRPLLGLDLRVPRWNRETQDVGPRPGVALGDGVDQIPHLRGQDGFGGHDPVQPAELAGVLAGFDPFEEIAVDQTTGEPHPHPHAGLRLIVERRMNQVVEFPVQVRTGSSGSTRATGACAAAVLSVCRSANRSLGRDQRPAAARSFSARSVRSQGRSTSVRPKWPYAAVSA